MSSDASPPSLEAHFPIHLGCVDAGSNGVRMAAARFADPNHFTLLEYQRSSVRLGHEVFLSGRLSDATIEAGIAAFRSFRQRFDDLGVRKWRAVATSAVREASNGADFLARVRQECGLELEIITGAEEARLVHLAVSRRIMLGDRQWLIVDLGGGSVEVSLVDADGIRWIESHTMGSVRLLEELTASGEDPSRFLQLLEEYSSTLRLPPNTAGASIGYIATGGNIETLARLAGSPADAQGVSRLAMGDLRGLIERLARMPYHQRVVELGLRPDRADVILPAGIVYERLGKLLGAAEIVVPGVGVKDGILYDLAGELVPEAAEVRHDRQVEEAAIMLGRKYLFDEAHGRHVALLAISIFDQTRSLHGLDRQSRRILLAAGILHEIGSFVSRSGHHRHSMYLISASGLLGFSPEEIDVVANVARYHRKSPPKPEHEAFQKLSKANRQRTMKLAALLRVADALDRDHAQRVQSVHVREDKSTMKLLVQSKGGLLLEAWSLKERSDLFRMVFGKKVTMELLPN
ncbi:MAG: Ppx/GppA phosphatase family protein [Planctomycetota bacterium]